MSRMRMLVLMFAACAPGVAWADAAADPPGQPVADLVVSSGAAPFRIRLYVLIDGEPVAPRFERVQAEYVRRLFAQLDRNRDGSLTAGEAAHAPSPDVMLPPEVLAAESENVNVAFNFRAVDEDGDGAATPVELLEFYQYFGGEPLQVRPSARRGDRSPLHPALLARLDADGDGAVSVEELSAAGKLAALDQNGDEVLTSAELLGVAATDANVAQMGTPNAARRTFAVRAPAAEQPDGDLLVHFTGDRPTPRIEIRPAAGQPRDSSVIELPGGADCQIQADCGPLRVLERVRELLILEFDGADEDGDGRIAADQRLPEMLQQRFPLLDGDDDRFASRAELDGYLRDLLNHESTMRRTQILITAQEPGGGLFDVLDDNRDGQLSLRELGGARTGLDRLDNNGDGRLETAELATSLRLIIRRGDLPPPYGSASDRGPSWFARMDRNLDGDVSANEFLGPPAVFEQFDANGDGFLELDEALQADSQHERPDGLD
jgi:Ca2+-binding EF-hand superfamily protein